MKSLGAVAIASLVTTASCSLITDNFVVNGFSGDEFPVDVDTSSGAIVIGVRQEGLDDRVAVLELLSPITLADPGADGAARVDYPDLILLGEAGPGGPIVLPRADFPDSQVISLHPCQDATCSIGSGDDPRPYDMIIGANTLAGDAIRLDLGSDQLFVLPDVAGDETSRSVACDAVLPSPFRGGGTLVISGTELTFGGRRIATGACIAANPDEVIPQSQRGVDAMFLVSTSIGISILGRSAYDRYALAQNITTPVEQLPGETVFLPSGSISGHLATLPALALVANAPGAQRSPCRQVYAHHFLTERDCIREEVVCAADENCASGVCLADNTCLEDCPCDDTSQTSCFAPAVVELTPTAGIDVLIVADDEPTLQSLRQELRPDQPEVDGILGTNALRDIELDVDYPHDRVLGRCPDGNCVARPEMPDHDRRPSVRGCLRLP